MGNQSYGGGQGQGGTFGRSQGFNPQSLGGMPGMNNAMQRFAPQPQMGGNNPTYGVPTSPQMPVAQQPQFGRQPVNMAPQGGMQMLGTGYPTPPSSPAQTGPLPGQEVIGMAGNNPIYGTPPPQYIDPAKRAGMASGGYLGGNWAPTAMAPPQSGPTPAQLAAHMAQRNNITNGYVEPGAKPTPQQLAAHMAANAAYTTGYGGPGSVPMPPWLR